MAVIGVDYRVGIGETNPSGLFWYILKGTSENDIMSSNGSYPADDTDRALEFHGYAGNDTITNHQNKSTIDGGAGNDKISLYGSSANNLIQYTTGDGNDIVYGFDGNDTLKIGNGTGTYSTTKSGNDIIVTVGDGKISLVGAASLSTVNIEGKLSTKIITLTENADNYTNSLEGAKVLALGGNDTIMNFDANVSIDAGDGNDSIHNAGSNVTINAGMGDDTILSYDNKFITINGGDGNDKITNVGTNVSIDAGDGNDSIHNADSNVTINAGDGNDFLYNYGTNVSIDGGDGDDTISNDSNIAYYNDKKNVTINGGAGNDSILSYCSSSVKINAGAGNDTIRNSSSQNMTIDGGAGDDKISLSSSKYYAESTLIEYTSGDGNDTIEGFNGDDTLKIGDGTDTYSKATVGNDIILTVGDGSILLKDAADEDLHIDGIKTIDSTNLILTNADNATINIGSSVKTVDASSRTKAVKITGNDLNNTIVGGSKNDTLNGGKGNDTLTGSDGKDVFIYDGGNDTITDYATGDKISLNASVKSFGASGKDFVFNFEDGSLTLANAASQKISVTSGKVTNVYSSDGISNTAGKAVTLNASAKTFTADSKVVTINAGLTSGATITGNSKANKIWLGDGSDVVIWSKGGNDTLMNFGANDLLSITGAVSDASVKSGNTYLKIGSKKITVKDSAQITFADDNGIRIFDNGIFYNADETSATIPASFKSNTKTPLELGAKEIDGSASKKSLNISSTGGASTILGSAKNDTITGSARNDKIDGGKGNDKLYGGAGNDTLTGGKGNDSLWGDDGADKFIYSKGDGKDVIFGFDDNDLLEIIGLGDNVSGSFNKAGTELTVKVGKTAVAVLKDFTTTTFNITANGTAHQITK